MDILNALYAIALVIFIILLFDAASRARLRDSARKGSAILLGAIVLALVLVSLFFATVLRIPLSIAISFGLILFAVKTPAPLLKLRDAFMRTEHRHSNAAPEDYAQSWIPLLAAFALVCATAAEYAIEHAFLNPLNLIATIFQGVFVGFGAGAILGIIMLSGLRKEQHHVGVRLGVIFSALLAYAIAEGLSGSGPLAVLTIGFFYAHSTFHERTPFEIVPPWMRNIAMGIAYLLVALFLITERQALSWGLFAAGAAILVVVIAMRVIAILALTRRVRGHTSTIAHMLDAPYGALAMLTVVIAATISPFAVSGAIAFTFAAILSIVVSLAARWIIKNE